MGNMVSGFDLLCISLANTSAKSRLCRFLGTFVSIVLFAWRYYHYPQSYTRVAEPMVLFFFGASEVLDILYAVVYAHIDAKEKRKSK